MKKIFWLLVLAIMLLGLCACGDKRTGEDDFQFMQGERIRRADVDYIRAQGTYLNEAAGEHLDDTLCLYSLVVIRTMIWEAEEQGVGISREEALATAKAHYAEAEAAGKAGQPTGEAIYQQPEYWDWLQGYMQLADMDVDEWCAYNAVTLQVDAAYKGLQEQIYADLTPEQLDDALARGNAQVAYQYGLAEKYKDRLVEEDLQPLLDEVMETLRQGSR